MKHKILVTITTDLLSKEECLNIMTDKINQYTWVNPTIIEPYTEPINPHKELLTIIKEKLLKDDNFITNLESAMCIDDKIESQLDSAINNLTIVNKTH